MRNLKKLLAVIVAVCVLATMAIPAFAADASLTDAEKLEVIGVMKGTGAGLTDAYLTDGTQRYQAAVMYLRLMGLEEEAYASDYEENYADATDVKSANMQKALGYLYANKDVLPGWKGVGADKFEPANPASAQMIYKVMLEALGYQQDVDFTWAETIDFAATVGLTQIAEVAELTNADLATAIVEALGTEVKDGGKTLIEKLVEDEIVSEAAAVEAGLVEAAPTALEVVSVTATNLRELVVTFNRVPVVDEAKKTANYKIEGNNPASVTLSDDNLTATLLMSEANKMGNYASDITLDIESEVGFAEDVKIDNLSVKDTTVPAALSVEATGPRNLKVTFSEPLDDDALTNNETVSSFKLDDGTVALDTTVASYSGRTLTLRTLADLKEGEHKLEVVNSALNKLVDSAAYKVSPATLTFNYAKDTTPISVAVEESTETTVKIKFNKAVNASTVKSSNVFFRHTYNTTTNQVTGDDAAVVNTGDDQTFTINFGEGKPFPPGTTNLYIKYDGDHKIKDNYGNELAETILSVTTTADLTKPVVEKVEFIDATTLEVTFSETVGEGAETEGNYTLKDSAGDAITINTATFKAETSEKVVTLDTATMNGGSYTLAVKDVKDISIAKNELDDVTISFTAVDKVAPEVSSVKQIGGRKVKVTFSEAMDPATAGDKSYWMYDGDALGNDDTVEMADSNKAVIITFENDVVPANGMTLARVKDAAGNWMEAFSTPLAITALARLTPTSVEMINKKTIKMKFDDEVISGAVVADFQVSFNGGTDWNQPIVGLSTTVTDGDTFIEITTDDEIDNTLGTDVQVRTSGGAVTVGAKNAYDNTLQFAGTDVSDKIAPEIESAATADTVDDDGNPGANDKVDRIVVVFSEDMYMPSINDSDFTVEGYEITGIEYVDNHTINIVVKEKDASDRTANPKVTVVGEVEDSARNKATDLEKESTPID